MQQTISLEKYRTREQHAQADSLPAGGFLSVAYERFLQIPVPVVLMVLWFAGVALLISCLLTLYVLGTSLASMAGA